MMKSCLWTAALMFAALVGVLTQTEAACAANPAKEAEEEATKQEVREMQIKYASYGCTGVLFAAIAYWVLNSTNQRKKKYVEDLKKQEHLDPNEGMPLM
jgi:hypothetical protein